MGAGSGVIVPDPYSVALTCGGAAAPTRLLAQHQGQLVAVVPRFTATVDGGDDDDGDDHPRTETDYDDHDLSTA